MALTQLKTGAIADDAVTEAKVANDAIGTAEMKAGTDGHVITYDASGNPTTVGPGTDGQVLTSTGAGSPPAFEDVPAGGITDIVSDTSPQLGGTLDCNGQDVQFKSGGGNVKVLFDASDDSFEFADSAKAKFGAGDDLQIYHDGTDTHIDNATSNLRIKSNDIQFRDTAENFYVDCNNGGSVDLYHNGTKQCETSANGLAFPSGKGINFSATGDGTGSNQDELFDDYEEGTWAPSLNNGTASVASGGTYIKCGKLCHLTVLLSSWSDTSSSTSILISGVPFNAEAQNVGTVWLRRTTSGGKGWVCTIGDSANNIINIMRHSDGNDMGQALQYSDFANASPYMNLTITYKTS